MSATHLSLAPLAAALLLGGCALRMAPDLDWLPDSADWKMRDIDEAEPPTWVAYQREALIADVQEIRVVGLVDATPEVTMRALRHRMLHPSFMPDGMDLEILVDTEEEVVTYGLASMPWPFRDREVTERLAFSHDPTTDVYTILVESFDTDEEVPRGVVRVPVVRNSYVVAPTDGGSVLTTDSVHDMGGAFPNGLIYGPVRNGMIDVLLELRELAPSFEEGGALYVADDAAGP